MKRLQPTQVYTCARARALFVLRGLSYSGRGHDTATWGQGRPGSGWTVRSGIKRSLEHKPSFLLIYSLAHVEDSATKVLI